MLMHEKKRVIPILVMKLHHWNEQKSEVQLLPKQAISTVFSVSL